MASVGELVRIFGGEVFGGRGASCLGGGERGGDGRFFGRGGRRGDGRMSPSVGAQIVCGVRELGERKGVGCGVGGRVVGGGTKGKIHLWADMG